MEDNEKLTNGSDEAEDVEADDTDKETEKEDEFDYDEDGNIIVPDVSDEDDGGDELVEIEEDEEEQDETGKTEAADKEEKADEEKTADVEPVNESKNDDKEDEKDKIIAQLKKENASLTAQGKETLKKLGVTTDNVIEGLEKLAAEAEDIPLEEYQKRKAETARNDEAKQTLAKIEFEKKAKSDLEELKKYYPETQKLTSIFQIENMVEFGRLRDLGLSPKQAYAAANADAVKANAANAAKQAALNETKSHLKSAVPKGSKDESISMTKRELAEWRDIFPDKSDKEIIKLYRDTQKN